MESSIKGIDTSSYVTFHMEKIHSFQIVTDINILNIVQPTPNQLCQRRAEIFNNHYFQKKKVFFNPKECHFLHGKGTYFLHSFYIVST